MNLSGEGDFMKMIRGGMRRSKMDLYFHILS